MENTPRETAEGPVLLSWEMPVGKRRLLFLAPIGLAALGTALWGLLVYYVRGAHRNPASGLLVFGPVSAWYLSPWNPHTCVRQLQCRQTGAEITTISGIRLAVSWQHVRRLGRRPLGLAVLHTEVRGRFYLPIPPEVLDKLIAILRETSNARIVGFGLQGS